MSVSRAYVDSSMIVAIALNEVGSNNHARRLEGFSQLLSSNLLEAELRATLARERRQFEARFISGIEWVFPGEIAFVTLDSRQRTVATTLGFQT